MQLPILKVLKKPENVFYNTLELLRELMGKFGRSVSPKVDLHQICGLQVKRNCPTRWWTDWLMCERVLEIHKKEAEALNTIISSYSKTWKIRKLKQNDFDLVSYFVEFFKIFKLKSDLMGGEEFSNIHFVHSTVKMFRRHINKWRDHLVIGSFVRDFEIEFSAYFDFIDNPDHPNYQQIYSVAAYLSPYHQAMLTSREKMEAKEYLRSEVSVMEDHMVATQEPVTAPLNVDSAADNLMPGMDLLLDLIQEGEVGNEGNTCVLEQAFNSDIEKLEKDTNQHIEMVKSGKSSNQEDILEYWNKMRYCSLSKLPDLACNLLVIPASSVPSERLFSISGLLSSGTYSDRGEYFVIIKEESKAF